MYDSYPRSETTMHGFQFIDRLKGRLRSVGPEAAELSDPHALIGMICELPDTVEGWRAQQVDVASEADAIRIRREGILHIVDHVARQPGEGFARRFFQAVDDVQQTERDVTVFDDALLPTVFARTTNSEESTPDARLAVAHWVAGQLDDDALLAGARKLKPEAQHQLARSSLYPERVRHAAEEAQAIAEAAAKQRELKAAADALEQQIYQERLGRKKEAQYLLEEKTAKVLMRARDADEFWTGYATFKEHFPNPEDYSEQAELARQAKLFNRWRSDYIKANVLTSAERILEDLRPAATLEVPGGCRSVDIKKPPSAHAIFPDLDSLIAAMDDFYAPRNAEGRLLEGYSTCTADKNKALVDQLLSAVRTWAAGDNTGPLFKDPMHTGSRGGSEDLLAYRGTALREREIEITRIDEGFVLNQADVGLYAGAKLTFGDSAEVEYKLAAPPPRPDDERVTFEGSGLSATLRMIDIPADTIARHIAQVLDPCPVSDDEHAIRGAILRPEQPYDYFRPSTTLTVRGATMDMRDHHNPRYRGHVPGIELTYASLSPDQAAVLWALAQQSKSQES